jgi:hypothetical protein
VKRDDLPTEHPNHASNLMGSPLSQNQSGSARPVEFELGRPGRTVLSRQQQPLAAASNGIHGKLAVELEAISLGSLSRGMGQAMNEVSVLRQYE